MATMYGMKAEDLRERIPVGEDEALSKKRHFLQDGRAVNRFRGQDSSA